MATSTYFVVHSLLADDAIKQWLTAHLIAAPLYRLLYNSIAIAGLVVLGCLFLNSHRQILWPALDDCAIATITGWLLLGAGALITLFALKRYDLGEFSGFSQWQLKGKPVPEVLQTEGLNARVRHPLYFGTLLAVWGWSVLSPSDAVLLLALITSAYLFIGARFEERKLEKQFGEAYRAYRRKVPMLIPSLRKSRPTQ